MWSLFSLFFYTFFCVIAYKSLYLGIIKKQHNMKNDRIIDNDGAVKYPLEMGVSRDELVYFFRYCKEDFQRSQYLASVAGHLISDVCMTNFTVSINLESYIILKNKESFFISNIRG